MPSNNHWSLTKLFRMHIKDERELPKLLRDPNENTRFQFGKNWVARRPLAKEKWMLGTYSRKQGSQLRKSLGGVSLYFWQLSW